MLAGCPYNVGGLALAEKLHANIRKKNKILGYIREKITNFVGKL